MPQDSLLLSVSGLLYQDMPQDSLLLSVSGLLYQDMPQDSLKTGKELYKHLCFRSNPLYVYNVCMLYIICIY